MVLELQGASGNAAVTRMLQREQATAPRPLETSDEAAKQSREAKTAFDAADYDRALMLWDPVRVWASRFAPDIELSVLYYMAISEARRGKLQMATSYADNYRSRPQHDPRKLEELLEAIHTDAEHVQPVPKVDTSAQAEHAWQGGEEAYARGDYDHAAALWRTVAEWASTHNPTIEASATYNVAMAKAHAGDFRSAEAGAKRYHSMPPRNPRPETNCITMNGSPSTSPLDSTCTTRGAGTPAARAPSCSPASMRI